MVHVIASGPSFEETLTTFTDELGFRLERIRPADDPTHATLTRGDLVVQLVRGEGSDPVESAGVESAGAALAVPDLAPELVVLPAGGDETWVTGRAGMRYRDLIPSRLGGRFIASNIEVCDGGPVPDLVHHHAIRFQLIVCQRGWVDVVYEDQGPPFRMRAGDAVLQPPHIRHRVLASSTGARVLEIGCPASHDTLFDHELELPNAPTTADRSWHGQRFVRHVGADAAWAEGDGCEVQQTRVADATDGLADVRFLRVGTQHDHLDGVGQSGELHFVFVLDGGGRLSLDGVPLDEPFGTGSALTLLPGVVYRLEELTPNTRLLEVRLPARARSVDPGFP